MNANKQAKVDVVKEISEKLNKSQAIVVADYAGLTVKEFQTLRTQLKEKDVELKVYKNRLFKIAAKEAGLDLEASLTGANVFAFGMSDDILPAKVLAAFAKDHNALELKAGTYEGKVIDAAGVNEVATLPSLEEALTMLAMQLIAPVKYVGVGLNMIAEDGLVGAGESESKTEETKTEEAPVADEKPAEEAQTEAPVAEETPAEEAKEEATPAEETPAEEAKEEAPAEAEVKEGE